MTRLWPMIFVALFLLIMLWPLITKAGDIVDTYTIEVTATIDPVFQVEVNCFRFGTLDDPQCQHALAELDAAGGVLLDENYATLTPSGAGNAEH